MRFAAAPLAELLAELLAVQRSTGIPNIVAGIPLSRAAAALMRIAGPLLGKFLTLLAARASSKAEPSPSAAAIAALRSRVWAEAGNETGGRVAAMLETGEGYRAAAVAAVHALELQSARASRWRSHTSAGIWREIRLAGARHTHTGALTIMAINETLLAQVFGIAALGFLCGFWFLPGGVLALRRRALGELQVDVRLGYSPETLYRLLELYGRDGIRWFRNMLIADMFFPAVYGTFLFLLGDLASAAHPAAGVVRALAIAATCFDYLENIFLLHVLHRLPGRQAFAARAAGICTTLKLLSFVAALGVLATVSLSPAVR